MKQVELMICDIEDEISQLDSPTPDYIKGFTRGIVAMLLRRDDITAKEADEIYNRVTNNL